MKRTSALTTVGLPLLGLLAIAAGMIALGHRDVQAFPAFDSYDPSGTAAFAELLRRQGLDVEADRRPTPRLSPRDVAIVFEIQDDSGFEQDSDHVPPFTKHIVSFIQSGGRAIYLPLDRNFQASSREALRNGPQEVVKDSSEERGKVTIGTSEPMQDQPDGLEVRDAVALWNRGDTTFAQAAGVGNGQIVRVVDGLGATNRFIDTADNAAILSALVRSLSSKGGRVVFTEASFGNSRKPSLLTMIGQWASVGWYQILFFFLVVVYTLGKRFGLPEEERTVQRGTRELVDAVASTYRRGRMSKVALRAALQDADDRIRKIWRIPRDASEGERDRVLPETLRTTIRHVEVALNEPRLRPNDALALAKELDRKVRDSSQT